MICSWGILGIVAQNDSSLVFAYSVAHAFKAFRLGDFKGQAMCPNRIGCSSGTPKTRLLVQRVKAIKPFGAKVKVKKQT